MNRNVAKNLLALSAALIAANAQAGVGSANLVPAPSFLFTIDAGNDGIDWNSQTAKVAITDLDGSNGNLFGEIASFTPSNQKFSLDYNLRFNPDPLLTGIVGITNLTNVTQVFTVNMLLPITPPVAAPSLYRGSITGKVLDGHLNGTFKDGTASLLDNTGNGIYAGRIDGASVLPLFGVSLTCSNSGCSSTTSDQSGGFPAFLTGGPAANTSIGTTLTFSLSAHDRVDFNTTFEITSPVPVPGAVWLFGSALGGVLTLRRRNASKGS